MTKALLEVKPHIVHFSGHGNSSKELILLDELGNPRSVSVKALVHLFDTLKDNVRLVVFNACSTKPRPSPFSKVIDYVVGMNAPVEDEAAVAFAASFYRAVGFGRTVKEAFELGRSALLMAGIPGAKTLRLSVRKGVDAETTVLVSPPVTKKSVEMVTTANRMGGRLLRPRPSRHPGGPRQDGSSTGANPRGQDARVVNPARRRCLRAGSDKPLAGLADGKGRTPPGRDTSTDGLGRLDLVPDLPRHLLPREDEVDACCEKLLGSNPGTVAITAPP